MQYARQVEEKTIPKAQQEDEGRSAQYERRDDSTQYNKVNRQ